MPSSSLSGRSSVIGHRQSWEDLSPIPHFRFRIPGYARIIDRHVKLSVLIPVYNEERTIDEILRLVARVPIEKEILVVDDGSIDGTREILKKWDGRDGVRVLLHPENLGKGRSVRTALEEARGEILVIQDADLEYDPTEYSVLLRPIEA